MKINLDEAIAAAEQAVEPWDLTLEVGGVDYPTRPLQTFELEVLKRLGEKPVAEQRAFLLGLFAGPAPDVHKWDDVKLGAAAVVVVTYFAERVKKKSLRLNGVVQERLAAARR